MLSKKLDYIDFEQVNTLLEGFNKTTGFVTAILDIEGNVLSKSGWRRMCIEFHRKNPETAMNCRISDTALANKLSEGENYHFYKCLNGLVDVAVPVVINGEHIANLFSGQFFFEKPDREFFKKQAVKYGFDVQEYLKALDNVPVVSEEKVKVAMDFLLNMTLLISEITLHRLEQEELNEKYRLISDNSDDWIYWMTPEGHTHYVSPACERVTGYLPEEFTGNHNLFEEIIYKPDQELVRIHLLTSGDDDSPPHNLEFRIVTKSGEILWVSHSCSPIYSDSGEYLGRRGTNRNITERIHKEEQLFESEFRFSKLYEDGPFGMVMANKDFMFRSANPTFCKIIGYSEEELRKLSFRDISHPDDLKKDMVNIQKLLKNEISVYKTEKRYIRKGGEVIWGSLTVTVTYDRDGQFLYILGVIEDITRRKIAEEKIIQLNERISTATRASHVGIWDWDIKNNLLQWDDQMYTLYGLKKEEFSGAVEVWVNGLHPDDSEFSQNQTRLALLGEKEYDTEFRVVWPDGTIHYLKARGEVFRDETGDPVRMVGINYDVTEQKKIDNKIREKDQEFRKLSANVPDLIYQFTRKPDGSYFVPIASEGIVNIFGCTPEEVKDDFTPIARVIYPEDAERVIREIEYSAENLTYFKCEFRVKIPGKDIQWIYSNSNPEKLPDGSVTWYGFNVDITQQKKAEDEIRKLNETLEERVEERTSQLEEAIKELDAFSYSVSHDLRSPLRHINGFADILARQYSDQLTGEAKRYLNTITDSAKKMGTLIDDLLSFSRTGRSELKKSVLEMNRVIDDALLQIKPSMDDRKIDWKIPHLPQVRGDNNLIRLVWVNLLDNAVKYTKTRKKAVIEIGYKEEKNEIVFFIKDNGAGFDMLYAHKLFGVFQRLHSSSEFEGTGIGLANVRRIIVRHGGRTWAEAETDKGATFYFSLPNQTEENL